MQELKNLLSAKQNVVITTHVNPDGDAIGSSVALLNFLIKMGHDVSVIVPNDYPDFLKWMKNDELIINYSNSKNESQEKIKNASLIFCLDFNNLNRINELGDYISESKAKKVLIDHHLDPSDFYDFKIHDVKASATAELVYNFLIELDSNAVDKDISEALYTGILTDTGSFKFSSASSYTHEVASKLMLTGFDHAKVQKSINDQNSISRLRLLGYALQKIKIDSKSSLAYLLLTKDELEKFDFQKGDTEGFVNYALSIIGVEVAVFIREDESIFKFSFI